jgi:hypothetical protein
MKSLGLLFGASILVWAALLYPAWRWWGELALIHSAAAWVLCVLPALATAVWALRHNMTPEARVIAVLGGSGIRLAASLGGGFGLTQLFPEMFPRIFWLWVGVFYLVMLTLEVMLIIRPQPNSPSVG